MQSHGRLHAEGHATVVAGAQVADFRLHQRAGAARRRGLEVDVHDHVGIVIELDPTFVDISVERWQRLTGETARHADTDQPFDRGGSGDQPELPAR